MKLNNHAKRVLSAIIGATVLIVFILKANKHLFACLILVCIVLGLKEFYHLLEFQKIFCFKYLGLLLGLFLALVLSFLPVDPMILNFMLTAIIISLLLRALSAATEKKTLNIQEMNGNIGGTLLGILYIPLCLSHLVLIRRMDHGCNRILFLLVIIWACDIGAYYTGKLLGKHLLCPTISPKKTIEGSIGGLIVSLIGAQVIRPCWWPQLSILSCLLLSFFIAVFAQLGDLSESLLKRSAGVKDTGMIIPGHGGLLDRIDSLLFGAPVLFYYSRFLLRGR
ncbi:MAG: phosphatidate cytidylyltransferase [bacterium]